MRTLRPESSHWFDQGGYIDGYLADRFKIFCVLSMLVDKMADGEGFEPSRRLRVCRFSRPVPSTTRPPIHRNNFKWLVPSSLATNRELQPDCNRQRSYQCSRGIPNNPPIAFAAAASAPLNKCRGGPGLRSPGHDQVGD